MTHTIQAGEDLRVQVGLIGYGQWQTSDRTGPGVTPEQSAERYKVNSLGLASNLMLPSRKASLGFKYFKEFSNRSTFQGYSVQFSGSFYF